MQTNNTTRAILLALVLFSFMGGMVHLFIMRFNTGDVYPAYSSLRSDPLGTRALFESLQSFDDLAVSRNYQLLRSVKLEPDTTLLYLGASSPQYDSVPEELVSVFDHLTQSGGRLVVSYLPVYKKSKKQVKNTCHKKKMTVEDKTDPQTEDGAGD